MTYSLSTFLSSIYNELDTIITTRNELNTETNPSWEDWEEAVVPSQTQEPDCPVCISLAVETERGTWHDHGAHFKDLVQIKCV